MRKGVIIKCKLSLTITLPIEVNSTGKGAIEYRQILNISAVV